MSDGIVITPIARVCSDFGGKFGIPRQSGVVPELSATVVFEPAYREAEALRGIEGFSHLWLIWGFSENFGKPWSPLVRQPRLGGNTRMGVFATRAPVRPNPLGLSCVKLESVELSTPDGPVLRVSGADLMDGTPIYDIKPYVPYVDARPEASGGFTAATPRRRLTVDCPPDLLDKVPPEKREALLGVLAEDPRPAYQEDPRRVYGLAFAGLEVRFTVAEGTLTVRSVSPGAQDFT